MTSAYSKGSQRRDGVMSVRGYANFREWCRRKAESTYDVHRVDDVHWLYWLCKIEI